MIDKPNKGTDVLSTHTRAGTRPHAHTHWIQTIKQTK